MTEPSPHPSAPATSEPLNSILHRIGAPQQLAPTLLATLGPDADTQLIADPWRLLDLTGVTVEQADHAARSLLGEAEATDPRRAQALVTHALRRAARRGHTVLQPEQLAAELRHDGIITVDGALQAALAAGTVVSVESATEENEEDEGIGSSEVGSEPATEPPEAGETQQYLALAQLAQAEEELGTAVNRLTATSEPIMDPITAAETIAAAAHRHDLKISPQTEAAVVTLALRGVCVLTHPAHCPAVAQLLLAAAEIADESGGQLVVAAPTGAGAAALRVQLPQGTDIQVSSVASLLYPPEPDAVGHEVELAADIVVVSGAMALDVEQTARLVTACGDGTHLVLLADPAELPSAGPGQVITDLVASGAVAVAALPPALSPGTLAQLATHIDAGELPQVHSPNREVVVVPVESATEATHRALQLAGDSVPRAFGIATRDTVLVTPHSTGEYGADALNAACKAQFNPGPGTHAGFDVGDRVLFMHPGSWHRTGELGVVREVTERGTLLTLDTSPNEANTTLVTDPAQLRHGWALPVTAAHGGQWPAVVAVLDPTTTYVPPLVYTLLTRAHQHLSIVHAAGAALAAGLRERRTASRHTRLTTAVREG